VNDVDPLDQILMLKALLPMLVLSSGRLKQRMPRLAKQNVEHVERKPRKRLVKLRLKKRKNVVLAKKGRGSNVRSAFARKRNGKRNAAKRNEPDVQHVRSDASKKSKRQRKPICVPKKRQLSDVKDDELVMLEI
jgi:hypothetical protein